jgi:quercetin dioxygenase-like cupin family protein
MSSCELPGPEGKPLPGGSRVQRFRPGASSSEPHTWEGVPVLDYKLPAAHHCGVLRSVLVGASGEGTTFQVRYFEISPGGNTTLEQHGHEHAVLVLRGSGEVQLGDVVQQIGFGDMVYVAPREVHQLRNASAAEPFGFLCIVDAVRDRPVPVENVRLPTLAE